MALLAAAALISCGEADRPPPVVVAAVDGAEWSVIRSLWEEGRLPRLKALAERGATARLRSGYGSKSPVVWTSIATGVVAERHGVTDFVVPTERGDVPLSSTMRRVPAIWNMLDAAGGRPAVLGFWATWPAEATSGLVVSDRVLLPSLQSRVTPPERAAEIDALAARLEGTPNPFPPSPRAALDRLAARLAVEIADEPFDLVIFYLKSTDDISHHYWKYFRPGRLGPNDPHEQELYGGRVPAVYEAMDSAVGAVVEAYGPRARFVVLSDHGFYGLPREKVRVSIDLDPLLAALGFLALSDGAVEMSKTRLFTYSTAHNIERKKIRCVRGGRSDGGTPREECERARAELEEALDRVRWSDGGVPFAVEDARSARDEGADFVVQVRPIVPEPPMLLDGRPIDGVERSSVSRISGSHGAGTPGIFIAAGPGIAPGTDLGVVNLHDVAPTLLYALGLPVAEDFDGRARTDLFDPAYAELHPLRTIATWGGARESEALPTDADPGLLDELRALGYVD